MNKGIIILFGILVLFSLASVSASVSEGLVTYYSFDETSGTNIEDLALGRNNGTTTNANQLLFPGVLGTAMNLNGTKINNMTVANSQDHNFTLTNYSMGFWINATTDTDNNDMVEKKESPSSLMLYIWNSSVTRGEHRFQFDNGTDVDFSVSGGELKIGIYQYIFMTWNGTISIYVDGDYKNTSAYNGTLGSNSAPLFFSCLSTPCNTGTVVDELGIWNRSLNSSEVSELYNGGFGLNPFAELIVSLNSPADNSAFATQSRLFNSTLTPSSGLNLTNATLLIWDSNDNLFDETTNQVTGNETNSTLWTIEFFDADDYSWNVLGCGEGLAGSSCVLAPSNFSFEFISINLTSPVNGSGVLSEENILNATLNSSTLAWINTTVFLYNISGSLFNTTTNLATTTYNETFWNISIAELGLWKWSVEGCRSDGCYLTDNSSFTNNALCIDIDHPDYGLEYVCSKNNNLTFLFNISSFRKSLFSDGSSSVSVNLSNSSNFSSNSTAFSIATHQYDEVDSISVNITGAENLSDFQINRINSTAIDRFYHGLLLGDNVYLNKDFLNRTILNLTYPTGGGLQRLLELTLDDSIEIDYTFSFNLTGGLFGVYFETNFTDSTDFLLHAGDVVVPFGPGNYSTVDIDQSNVSLLGGFVIINGTNKTEFLYDDFEDDSINWTKWKNFSDVIFNTGNGFDFTVLTSESQGSLTRSISVTLDPGSTGLKSVSRTGAISPEFDLVNLMYVDDIFLEFSYDQHSDQEMKDVGGGVGTSIIRHNVSLGNVTVWQSQWSNCGRTNGAPCDEDGETPENIMINMTKQQNGTWRVQISGSEKISGDSTQSCGPYNFVYNWTTGSFNESFGSCSAVIGSLDNDFFVFPDYSETPLFLTNGLACTGITDAGAADNFGCQATLPTYSNLSVLNVNYTLQQRQNSTLISEVIYSAPGNIESASFSGVLLRFTAFNGRASIDTDTTAFAYYLSNDNGTTWSQVNISVPLASFPSFGTELRYRIDFLLNTTSSKFVNNGFVFAVVNVSTLAGNPSNISIDVNGDGVVDANFLGELNSSNSPVRVDVNGVNLSTAFSNSTQIYNHTYQVPVSISSDSVGFIQIDTINFTYSPNPVVLNHTLVQSYLDDNAVGRTNITLDIGGYNGSVNLTDLRFDYAGGNDTTTALVYEFANKSNNDTLLLNNFYSKWDFSFVPDFVEYLEFIPQTNESLNVTPFGQNNNTAILNITNLGYGHSSANLSIWLNGTTESCVDLTLSLNSNKSDGNIINESWRQLTQINYLSATDIYLWGDFSCNFTSWRFYNPDIFFRQCVSGADVCSEDLS